LGCVSCTGLVKEFSGTKDQVILQLKESSTIPIEADSVTPDLFAERDHAAIKALPMFYGRRNVSLGDLFEVDGERSDRIVVQGDLQHIKKIGQGMSRGRIEVRGDVGPHLGVYMRGGEITVQGNAGDWAGAHMQGGRIWIHGNAGHHLGAAYPGEKRGLNRGVIIVNGNAGSEIGAVMRRGLIVVMGNVGEYAGARMIAGSVFVFGHLAKRAGAGMKRGSIIAFGTSESLLPTYRFESVCRPVFLGFFLNRLQKWGVPVTPEMEEGSFRRYSGDITSLGKGEILIHEKHE
jgi:formylmethanofuran dehydrogenase subunit C